MSNQLHFITDDLHLQQSELYGENYSRLEENFIIPTYNDLSIHTLHDWANSLSNSYDLNNDQLNILSRLVKQFDFILTQIDPLKIKDIQTSTIDETDLLIWRETSNYIVELTLDDEGYITYRKTFKNNSYQMEKGIFGIESDFQSLLFQFLS